MRNNNLFIFIDSLVLRHRFTCQNATLFLVATISTSENLVFQNLVTHKCCLKINSNLIEVLTTLEILFFNFLFSQLSLVMILFINQLIPRNSRYFVLFVFLSFLYFFPENSEKRKIMLIKFQNMRKKNLFNYMHSITLVFRFTCQKLTFSLIATILTCENLVFQNSLMLKY